MWLPLPLLLLQEARVHHADVRRDVRWLPVGGSSILAVQDGKGVERLLLEYDLHTGAPIGLVTKLALGAHLTLLARGVHP